MGELYIFEYDSKKIMRKNIILTVLGAVGVLAAVLFFAYCSLLLTEKTIVKVLTYAVIVIAAVLIVMYLIKDQAKRHKSFLSELEKLPDISEMNRQAERAEFMLGAFCLLEKYLYVPKQRLLVPYTEIESVGANKVNVNFIPTSAMISIKCRNRRYYSVSLNSAFDLNNRYGEFIDALNEKRSVCFTQNTEN